MSAPPLYGVAGSPVVATSSAAGASVARTRRESSSPGTGQPVQVSNWPARNVPKTGDALVNSGLAASTSAAV